MSSTTNPKQFLERREAEALARLKHHGRELTQHARENRGGSSVVTPAPIAWVRRHPLTAVGGAAGVGFLAAPRLRRRKNGSSEQEKSPATKNVSRLTIASQVMVVARLVDSINRLVRGALPKDAATAPSGVPTDRMSPSSTGPEDATFGSL